jgi:hypothetical protein
MENSKITHRKRKGKKAKVSGRGNKILGPGRQNLHRAFPIKIPMKNPGFLRKTG